MGTHRRRKRNKSANSINRAGSQSPREHYRHEFNSTEHHRIYTEEDKLQVDDEPPLPKPNARWNGNPVRDEAHETGDDHLYYWHKTGRCKLLVFDAHGLRYDEAASYFRWLLSEHRKQSVVVIHGYRHGTTILWLMLKTFGRKNCRQHPTNQGLSTVNIP